MGGNIRSILPTAPVAPAYNKEAVTLLYQHNRNWVPDARERLFAAVVLLIAGGRGRTVSQFRKENVDNYCSCEKRY